VRMISTAQTGFFYTTQRTRQGPKLSAVKYDPKGACSRVALRTFVVLTTLYASTVKARVLFVESNKTKKK
jgi:large subunit ribosomal protein L33